MNRAQRLLCLAALLFGLWEVGVIASPFGDDCGAPAVEAFRGDRALKAGETTTPEEYLRAQRSSRGFGVEPGNPYRYRPSCRAPARRRLQRAIVLLVLAGVGTAGGSWLLRDPKIRRPTPA